MKLIVLSDLHLVPLGETLAGLDTCARLEQALKRLEQAHRDADVVVIAGDLRDKTTSAPYDFVRAALCRISAPVMLTLGNHDDRDAFAGTFPEHITDGFAQAARDINDLRVVVLDTLVEGPGPWGGWGMPSGALCERRLAWLDAQLGPGPTFIAMHHAAYPVGIGMDQYGLENADALMQRLKGRDVRAVVAGHIHMTTLTHRHRIPFLTLAGCHATSRENVPDRTGKRRFAGPGDMLVALWQGGELTMHFEDYLDGYPELSA
ncbi:MAG: metallophosphoesterase [Pseudomonadota bacterium]